ncbi:MAG: AAA family ATPase, partial [Pseudomonadota bacterium]
GAEAMNFIPVRPPDLLSQFLGQAERGLAQLFETARLTAPSLLFFDEIDALAPRRGTADAVFDRLVAQLLVELDGIAASPGVTVLAATNRAATLDPALLRPGRFDRIIDIPPPDATARKAILEVHFTARPLADATAIDTIVAATAGASGADLAALAEAAAWHALSRALASKAAPEIARVDIDAALVDHDKAAHARRRDHIAEPEVSG